jgi:hypothetical protein
VTIVWDYSVFVTDQKYLGVVAISDQKLEKELKYMLVLIIRHLNLDKL